MQQFLAVYTGKPSDGPPADMSPETIQKGMRAWGDWMQKHADAVIVMGGPLGRTKKVSAAGFEDIRNYMSGFIVIQAEDHDAAARMFEGHPQFTIFPGEGVEVMPVMPIPQMPD